MIIRVNYGSSHNTQMIILDPLKSNREQVMFTGDTAVDEARAIFALLANLPSQTYGHLRDLFSICGDDGNAPWDSVLAKCNPCARKMEVSYESRETDLSSDV